MLESRLPDFAENLSTLKPNEDFALDWTGTSLIPTSNFKNVNYNT